MVNRGLAPTDGGKEGGKSTRGFQGNSPQQSFSNAQTHALLLVRMQAGVFNCKSCSVSLQLGWMRPLPHKGAR